MTYLKRWQKQAIEEALNSRRVVILAGARQTGKTTLAKKIAGDQVVYRTLDDRSLLQAAHFDPQDFVAPKGNLMIIDEIQKAPDLLPAIKKVVDENPRPGQYLLTGSANIQALPGAQESLAGRIRKIPLRPLSQGEINGHKPDFLPLLFAQTISASDGITKDELITRAMVGGYPEVLHFQMPAVRQWHTDYIDALVERDLKDIANIHRVQAMHMLVQAVAAWSTKAMDISSIASSLSITRPTVESYINALETMYLIDYIQPYLKTDYERVAKKPKLIMNDSGLMSSLLRWRFDNVQLDGDKLGKLVETHVGNELQKHIDAHGDSYHLYYYRDREKREIDFIIERDDGAIAAIEVKASTVVSQSDFKHIKWFMDHRANSELPVLGVVLYAGQHILSFGASLWAMPISCLYSGVGG